QPDRRSFDAQRVRDPADQIEEQRRLEDREQKARGALRLVGAQGEPLPDPKRWPYAAPPRASQDRNRNRGSGHEDDTLIDPPAETGDETEYKPFESRREHRPRCEPDDRAR